LGRLFRFLGRRLGEKVQYLAVREWGARRGGEHVHFLLRVACPLPPGVVAEGIGRAVPGATHSCQPLRCPLAAIDYVLKAGRYSGSATVPPRGKGRLLSFSRGFLGRSPRKLWASRQKRRRGEKG
jgi:hypothetical protein